MNNTVRGVRTMSTKQVRIAIAIAFMMKAVVLIVILCT
jgi:hypothetical protein